MLKRNLLIPTFEFKTHKSFRLWFLSKQNTCLRGVCKCEINGRGKSGQMKLKTITYNTLHAG